MKKKAATASRRAFRVRDEEEAPEPQGRTHHIALPGNPAQGFRVDRMKSEQKPRCTHYPELRTRKCGESNNSQCCKAVSQNSEQAKGKRVIRKDLPRTANGVGQGTIPPNGLRQRIPPDIRGPHGR